MIKAVSVTGICFGKTLLTPRLLYVKVSIYRVCSWEFKMHWWHLASDGQNNTACRVTNVIYSNYTTKQKLQKPNPLKNKVCRSDEGVEDEKHRSEAVFPCTECGVLILCPGNHSELSSIQQVFVELLPAAHQACVRNVMWTLPLRMICGHDQEIER